MYNSFTSIKKIGNKMSRMIFCKYLQKETLGLDHPIIKGSLGEKIFNNISQEAFEKWQKVQTMLINEHKLNLLLEQDRKFVYQKMEEFLFENIEIQIEGYVPKTDCIN